MAKTIFELTEGNAPALTDYALTGEDPAGTHVLRRTTWQSLKNLFLADVTNMDNIGWLPMAGPWTYASQFSVNIPANQGYEYSTFSKIRLTQNGVNKYFYLNYATPNTLNFVSNTDFSVENTTTYPITNMSRSNLETPGSFPAWFNYTPTGIATSNVTLSGRFNITNRTCKVQFLATFTGGITFTTMPTLPIPSSANLLDGVAGEESIVGIASYLDSGTSHNPTGLAVSVTTSGTTFGLRNSAVGGAPISATSPITWANGDLIHAQFEYEI